MSKRPGDPGYAPGWCIHYRFRGEAGEPNPKTCEAGVPYARFEGTSLATRPCFLTNGQSRPGATVCENLRRPTPEEIAEHEEWARGRMRKLALGMEAVLPYREQARKTKRGVGGEIACPACENGMLRFSIAGSNGHCHAHCSTEGCLSWME